MTEFWLAFAVFAILILFALLTFLWANRTPVAASGSANRQADNVRQHKRKLEELAASLAVGEIEQSTFNALQSDAQRQLLEDTASTESESSEASLTGAWLLWLVVALIPLLGLLLYLPQGAALGASDDLVSRELLEEIRSSENSAQRQALFERLLIRLESTVKRKPDNDDARILLAKTHIALQQHQAAVEVYRQHLARYPESADAHAMLAESMYLANGGKSTVAIKERVDEALRLQPNHPFALSLRGMAAFSAGDYALAKSSWLTAVRSMPAQSQQRLLLENGIREAESRMQEAASDAVGSLLQGVKLHVSLSDAINVADLPPTAAVFVFARDPQGPPMPLAAKRLRVSELPLEIQLTERDQMAGTSLADRSTVDIYARLSLSGQPTPNAGDWEGRIAGVLVSKDVGNAEVLALQISERR